MAKIEMEIIKKMNTAETIVQKQLDSYNNRDLQPYLDCFADDIEVFNFSTGEMTYSGKDKLREIYANIFEKSPNLHCELLNRIVFDNKVIDHEKVTGRIGVDITEIVAIYEIKNGLISKAHFMRKE